jgi:flavin reductase (DIM6/NTAB) family NADH-FMN oxidoreductase RutF
VSSDVVSNPQNLAESVLPEAVRAFHRRSLSGVMILTTTIDGAPRGMALNAFASVSLEPAVVLACVARTASTYRPLLASGRFALNVLAADQTEVAAQFARSGGAEKFENVRWRIGGYGSPILDGTCGYLEAHVETRVAAHTHDVFFGRVVDAASYNRVPLGYLAGHFCDVRDPDAWDGLLRSLSGPAAPPCAAPENEWRR